MSTKSNGPVVLVESSLQTVPEQTQLTAYSGSTGKVKWRLKQRKLFGASSYSEVTDGIGLAARLKGIWTRTSEQIILADETTGKDLLRFPLSVRTRYDLIDNRYAFVQQGSEEVESSLLDMRTGRNMFSQQGRAELGQIERDILYYRLDGKAMAFDLRKGAPVKNYQGDVPGPYVTFKGAALGWSTDTGSVYLADPVNRRAVHRLLDVQVGTYDFIPELLLRSYLSVDGQSLFVGSSNGYFGKISRLPS